jgi:hypothetical protein
MAALESLAKIASKCHIEKYYISSFQLFKKIKNTFKEFSVKEDTVI